MFERFEAHFRKDADLSGHSGGGPLQHADDAQLCDLLLRFGGVSFNNGLYRVVDAVACERARTFILQAFADFADRVRAFAYDWLGRLFVLDEARLERGLPSVLMFEPGTGQSLEIPCNVATFHDDKLISYSEEALAAGFHKQWLDKGGAGRLQGMINVWGTGSRCFLQARILLKIWSCLTWMCIGP